AIGVTAAALVAAVMIFGAGNIGTLVNAGKSSDMPPCSSLPALSVVTEKLTKNAAVVAEYQEIGPEVKVTPITPCADKTSALAQITYADDSQRDAIRNLINRGPALETSIHLEKV
ncbi:MAG: hypothetical protein ACRC0L_09825, partial [Angustibacter sp.]